MKSVRVPAIVGAALVAAATRGPDGEWGLAGLLAAAAFAVAGTLAVLARPPVWRSAATALGLLALLAPPAHAPWLPLHPALAALAMLGGLLAVAVPAEAGPAGATRRAVQPWLVAAAWLAAPVLLVVSLAVLGPARLGALAELDLAGPVLAAALLLGAAACAHLLRREERS